MRWKVRDSWARGGRPACDDPTWLCCGGRGEWGVLVHKPALDHSEGWERLLTSAAGWGSPKGAAVEYAGGTKAPSQPCIGGLVYSRALRIALTRTRRVRGSSSRLVSQAYMLLRVYGPSIAWVVGEG